MATALGYISVEVANTIKLADDNGTRSHSRHFTKQIQEQVVIAYISPLFHTKQTLTQISWLFAIQLVLLFMDKKL